MSRTIGSMLEVSLEDDDDDTTMSSPILVDCPHTDVLEKVLDWAKHHKVIMENNDNPSLGK